MLDKLKALYEAYRDSEDKPFPRLVEDGMQSKNDAKEKLAEHISIISDKLTEEILQELGSKELGAKGLRMLKLRMKIVMEHTCEGLDFHAETPPIKLVR